MMRAGSYIIFFIQFGDNIQTARQLRNAVVAKFFDKSFLLLINFVCYYNALPCHLFSMFMLSCAYAVHREYAFDT